MQFLSQIFQSNCTLQLFLTKTLKLKNNHMAFSELFWLNNFIEELFQNYFKNNPNTPAGITKLYPGSGPREKQKIFVD